MDFFELKCGLMAIAIDTLRNLILLVIYPLWFWFLLQVLVWLW